MQKEKSAGTVVFRKEKDKLLFLLLYKKPQKQYKESWDFPKGWPEEAESEQETAARETKEETGIKKLTFNSNFREKVIYFYKRNGKLTFKEVIFFLAETKQKQVKLSFEHADYKWFEYEEALERLTFKTSKKVFKKIKNYLV